MDSSKKERVSPRMQRLRELPVPEGFYCERDGGDWYIVAPNWRRIAEGFVSRVVAREVLAWIAYGPSAAVPDVKALGVNALYIEVQCNQDYAATIWVSEARNHFPDRVSEIIRSAVTDDPSYAVTPA